MAMPIGNRTCICKNADKKYFCSACGVQRENLFDHWEPWTPGDEPKRTWVGSEPKPDPKPNPQDYCQHLASGVVFTKIDGEWIYLCQACGATAEEKRFLNDRFGDDVGKRRKKNRKNKNKQQAKAPASKTIVKKGAPKSTGSTTTYTHTHSKCRHYSTPVQLPGGFVVHASSLNNKRTADDIVPDWGLYADWSWRPYWRAEHIDWPDFGIPGHDAIAFEQLLEAVERIQRGQRVEVGCIGGHGRTGTMIAAMCVMLGMEPKTAVKYVRDTYCHHAIETDRQEWWVEFIDSEINGTELRPEPADYYGGWGGSSYGGGYSSTGYSYTPGKKSTTTYPSQSSNTPLSHCSMPSHFYEWLRGKSECPHEGDKCKYWKGDTEKFNKGQYGEACLGGKTFEWHKDRAVKGMYHPRDARSKAESTSTTTGREAKLAKVHTSVTPRFHDKPVHKAYYTTKDAARKHHNTNPKCNCDVCRYLRAGFEAFLMPVDFKQAGEWTKTLSANEDAADKAIAARLAAQAPKAPESKPAAKPKVRYFLLPDDEFMEVTVADEFPEPPNHDPLYPYQIIDSWQWEPGLKAWIWIDMLMGSDYLRRKQLAAKAHLDVDNPFASSNDPTSIDNQGGK